MSAEAWAAFLDAVIDSLRPIAYGAWGGWMLRGAADARRHRRTFAGQVTA